jgi:8-oxo-dGTP diphosphatase
VNPRNLERPTWVDLACQLGYLSAYQVMRAYWHLRKPTTRGALVMLWCRGHVLLVRNSYLPYYSAPGGYLRRDETARDAALRELHEEVRLAARPDQLAVSLELTHEWEGKQDHVTIFALQLDERPHISVDYREVVEAFWFRPDEVQRSDVFPPLKQAILAYSGLLDAAA